VADFATTSATHAATLAHRERREVVVQHERVFFLAFQGVDLCVTGGAQRGNDQGLGFATGEQRRTVGRGSTPTSMFSGRTVRVSRPSIRGLPFTMFSRTVRYSISPKAALTSAAEGWPSSPDSLATTWSFSSPRRA
jgi:hypothetical protein